MTACGTAISTITQVMMTYVNKISLAFCFVKSSHEFYLMMHERDT
jgi:hypothetical protein